MKLDDVIKKLEELRNQYGGDIDVKIWRDDDGRDYIESPHRIVHYDPNQQIYPFWDRNNLEAAKTQYILLY